jgi:hypothetical protein
MRGVHAAILCLLAALALSGCASRSGAVAAMQPRSDLDSLAYGQPYDPAPRARRDRVTVTHTDGSGSSRYVVPLGTPLGPGDTVFVSERWF